MISKRYLIHLSQILIITLIIIQPVLSKGEETIQIDTHISSSCTIFTVSIGDTVFFGNNEDYLYDNYYRWYNPAQNVSTSGYGEQSIYGAVFFGFGNNSDPSVDWWEQGGMNEYGLCFDGNGLPNVLLNLDPSSLSPYTSHALAQILWECKTVYDVIAWYQNHRWYNMGGQIHYADRNGDAVVVGANSTGQWVFTRKESNFLVSTNFNLNDTSHGWYPCERYNTATQMLSEITEESDLNVSACADVLYAVHQEGTYATRYSNICDPVNLEFYFNYGDGYSEQERFNLTAELADEESFTARSSYMGVFDPVDGVLARIDQIPTTLETPTTSADADYLLPITICLSSWVIAYVFVRKKYQ